MSARAALAIVATVVLSTGTVSAARPNILIAIADDQSYPHSSAYGDPAIKTPAFDRVARSGVLFRNAFTPAPVAGGASGSSGQRARGLASSPSERPRRSRSIPAHAIIAALSVQSRGGGATRRRPAASATSESRARSAALAATPPATTSELPSAQRSRNAAMAFPVRSASTSATAAWKPAHRSATSRPLGASGSASTAWRTAVLSPENEKSQPARRIIGRGRAKRSGSPSRAARSTAGPPG
ncbi:MAG: sulfatase-like hydrolase/transferase [Candidatus Krumholzibacteriota bacterium]|nr:sulfatase-like hydrolase/transferase [Candidatus Krumholzibacteriota bacterium]